MYVCKHLLWVLQFRYMSYYLGFDVPWVYMSQYWHFGNIFYLPCAPRAEGLKNVFLCFWPEPMLIMGLKDLDCFHAKA